MLGIKEGRAKIELFDAKTGELTQKVESKNMVTNAVKNVLNGYLAMLGYSGNSNWLNQIKQSFNAEAIWKNMFGGLLVFGDSVIEDEDHIIPSLAEKKTLVGCGFQGATQANSPYLGSINSELSEVTSEHVKMVWDFTTGQSNGAIAALCLTSNCGGAGGIGDQRTDYTLKPTAARNINTTNLFNPSNFSNTVAPYYPLLEVSGNSNGTWIAFNEDKTKLYLKRTTDTKIRVYDLTRQKNRKLNIFTKGIAESPASYTELATTLPTYYDQICTIGLSGVIYYWSSNDNVTYWNRSSGQITNFNKIDLETGTITPITTNFSAVMDFLNTKYPGMSDTAKSRCLIYHASFIMHSGSDDYLVGFYYNGFSSSDVGGAGELMILKVSLSTGQFSYRAIPNSAELHKNLLNNTTKDFYYDQRGTTYVVNICGDIYFRGNQTVASNTYAYYMLDTDTLAMSEHPAFFGLMLDSQYNWLPSYEEMNNFVKAPWVIQPYSNPRSNTIYLFGLAMFMPYLATINNLDSVLTKDSTKTMRVTYVLELAST